jgi:hypothetical protein
MPWLKMVPRAMAEGLTGGRSGGECQLMPQNKNGSSIRDGVKTMRLERLSSIIASSNKSLFVKIPPRARDPGATHSGET